MFMAIYKIFNIDHSLWHYKGGEPTSWSLMFHEKISDQVIKQGISGVLKVRFLFCKAQLVPTNFLYPYQMLSFYEIKSFTRALRTLTIWSVFRNALANGYIYISWTKDNYFRSVTLIRANCFLWHWNRRCSRFPHPVADYFLLIRKILSVIACGHDVGPPPPWH